VGLPGAARTAALSKDDRARLLVVDDELTILELLSGSLRFAGFDVVSAASGTEAMRAAAREKPDLALLDVMLPDGDGFEVLRQIRARGPGVPVIFLSARGTVHDRVAGLTLGGNDYITKPLSLDEVLARIRAVLRRAGGQKAGSRLVVADLVLDADSHEVRRAGRAIALTPTEFRLLRYLMVNAGRVLSKAQILDHVWDCGSGGDGNVVESCVSYLRRKVDDGGPQLIHTIGGMGLRPAGPAPARSWPGHRAGSRLANASLSVRITAAATVLVMVTLTVTGALGTIMLRSYLLGRVDAQLRAFASGPRPARLPAHLPRGGPPQPPSLFLVEQIGADGRVQTISGSVHGAAPLETSAARLRDPGGPFTAAAAGDPGHWWRVVVRAPGGGRHVVIAYSLDALNSTVGRLEAADAAAGTIAILILAAIGFPVIRLSLNPLARIEDAAEAIAGGDLSRRIDRPAPATEVRRLAAVLNTMLGRIEAAYRARQVGETHARDSEERMRRFVADASHELRTPLISVRGLADLCLQRGEAASRKDLIRLVTRIEQEAARMGLLVEDLLLLAQFDADRPVYPEPADLSSVAAEAVLAARTVPHGHLLTLAAPDPVIVFADSVRLRQ
jgi:two-component system OmpR family response regulator